MRLSLFQRLILSVLVLLLFIFAGQSVYQWVRHAGQGKSDDVLTVGMIDDTPPFCFYNDENRLVGVNIDIVNEMAQRMGKRPHIESVSFNRLTSGLMTHQYDVVSIGSITHHRAKVVRYVSPHLTTSDVLLVHQNLAHLKSLESFKNQSWRVGVYNGSSYIQLLKDLGLENNMVIYPNQRDVFLAFYKQRVDAIIMIEEVGRYIQQHLDKPIAILPEKIRTGKKYAFAVRKEDLGLWRELNLTIEQMLADGSIDRIFKRWIKDYRQEGAS